MAVANTVTYYHTATITAVKYFVVQTHARLLTKLQYNILEKE